MVEIIRRRSGSATATPTPADQWAQVTLADSPVTLTYDNLRVVDATGSDSVNPLILNVTMGAIPTGKHGEITLSDIPGQDTWVGGYVELRFTDGTNPLLARSPAAVGGGTSEAADGVVIFSGTNGLNDQHLHCIRVGNEVHLEYRNL